MAKKVFSDSKPPTDQPMPTTGNLAGLACLVIWWLSFLYFAGMRLCPIWGVYTTVYKWYF